MKRKFLPILFNRLARAGPGCRPGRRGPGAGEADAAGGGSPGSGQVGGVTASDGLEGPPLRRTRSGLVIATSENVAWLLSQTKPPGRVWWDKAEMELCLVGAGEFLMGSTDDDEDAYVSEKPQHRVCLDSYYLGRYPVTVSQFRAFVEASGYRPWSSDGLGRPEDHPVVWVSWDEAVAYCKWAGLRLPTEAEWEYAARGPDAWAYPWGDEWDARQCNTWEGRRRGTTPVGKYSPGGDSPYGCADMAGNVWEWCADWYGEDYYACSPSRNPQGPGPGDGRVLRGGSCHNYRNWARCAYRYWYGPDNHYVHFGFRCCVSPTSSL